MLDSHLERAFSLAVEEVRRRQHEYLTLEHLLYGILLEMEGKQLLAALGINVSELRRSLDAFFSENIVPLPRVSDEIIQTMALQRVMQRTLRQMHSSGRETTGIGDVLACLLEEESCYAAFFLLNQGLHRLDVLEYISYEAGGTQEKMTEEEDEEEDSDTRALKKYTMELTRQAAEGKLDPLIGRVREIERAMQILARRRKNNPLFVGEPGVGKTALAEGLALRIVSGDVPDDLRDARLFSLDLGGMMAGAKYRGDFEGRLKAVIAAIRAIPKALLFIDEIHTMVGAGAVNGGSLDASNILKPALGSGELRCIGSTTHEELRNHFEKDRAFSRRFQKIEVPEPSHEECLLILRGLQSRYEDHHGVRYTPAALESAVSLSAHYLPEARLPDKAIDLLDEAGARKRLNFHSDAIIKKKTAQARTPGKKKGRLSVGVADIENIVSIIARVPAVKATASDRVSLGNLEKDLKKVVFGQERAVEQVAKAVLRSRAGFVQEGRPQGAFLFYGPTGVGKTELARQLAASLKVSFLRYDMSEYMEKHAVARLIGAPPGYVGFEQGGLLTEAVRKTPNAVLLLDEMEKAHPDIFNILLQVMDYATLTDSSGRKADFRNVIIIMTTNAGTFEMSARGIGFGSAQPLHATEKARKALERIFTPEFRNRLDGMVGFSSLSQDIMRHIVDKFLKEMQKSLVAKKVTISFADRALEQLARWGFDPVFGARPLARVVREKVEDVLASEILFGKLTAGGHVHVDAKKSETPVFSAQPHAVSGLAVVQEEYELVFTCTGAAPLKPGARKPADGKRIEKIAPKPFLASKKPAPSVKGKKLPVKGEGAKA